MSQTKICPQCGATYDEVVAFCALDGASLVREGQQGNLIGTVIAERYRIVSRIGEGGMGEVYLAEHVRMKRMSAIKIMRSALVGEVEALRRFTREAENASQLSHPNIAAIFDFGDTSDGVVYLAMEYIDGESLGAKLDREGVLHPDVAADILGQSADALQAAHDLNMLHRDIKPDNIMLARRADGTYMVKLVDFGIARSMDGSDQKVTRTGFSIGTPEYMSPEQLSGSPLDARSDQYALALVAFYALTGKQAFPSESSKESLIARLTSRPQTLQEAKRDVEWDASLQDIFNRALSPEPHERFDTVSEFAHALAGAISAMTPTQTAELYRRALDMRLASVAARTPHGDFEALRTPSSPHGTLGNSSAAIRASGAASSLGASQSVRPIDVAEPAASKGLLWKRIAVGVATLAIVGWFMMNRPNRTAAGAADSTTAVSRGDTAKPVAVAAATPAPVNDSTPTPPTAVKADTAAIVTPPPTPTPPVSATQSSKALADSARKFRRDSIKKEAAKKALSAKSDSVSQVRNVRLRFPEASLQTRVARGFSTKDLMVRGNDIRVVIMPTPMFVWRAAQARAWNDANAKPGGGRYDAVDPIERWSAWSGLVSTRRAVYAVEVTNDKVPWPSYTPDKLVDLRRGDITNVEFFRDGVPVAIDNVAHIAALVNATDHVSVGKFSPKSFVGSIAPTVFLPHDDGAWPKIEVLVHDAERAGGPVRMTLPAAMVKRMYDEFGPWRDAIARP